MVNNETTQPNNGWEDGCIDYAENMYSGAPHVHILYCKVIAESLDEQRQEDLDRIAKRDKL